MKRSAVFFLICLALPACQPAYPAGTTPLPGRGTEPAPVFVPALCALMGNPSRSEVPAGHPVILIWGWSAAAEEQIQDYLKAATVAVTFDGIERTGIRQGGMPYDDSAKVYRVVWISNVGIPASGVHTITYFQTFASKIFDGSVYYGPGTKNEKQEDKCEIVVQ